MSEDMAGQQTAENTKIRLYLSTVRQAWPERKEPLIHTTKAA